MDYELYRMYNSLNGFIFSAINVHQWSFITACVSSVPSYNLQRQRGVREKNSKGIILQSSLSLTVSNLLHAPVDICVER